MPCWAVDASITSSFFASFDAHTVIVNLDPMIPPGLAPGNQPVVIAKRRFQQSGFDACQVKAKSIGLAL